MEEDYYKALPAPPHMASLAHECAAVITRYTLLGTPLWLPVPSSAYASLLAGAASESMPLCALTWDSSPLGWAGLLCWRAVTGLLQEQLLVGTWLPCWDVMEQPFSEALGRALAFEAALQVANLTCLVCILHNDASAAIAGFCKGSVQSRPIQWCALCLSRCAAQADVNVLPWHVLGLQLMDKGIDWASWSIDDFGPGSNVQAIIGLAV